MIGTKRLFLNFSIFLSMFALALLWAIAQPTQAQTEDCDVWGWFPDQFGLKDHTVFTYNNQYYLASIDTRDNTHFAYGVSADLCHWETLPYILEDRPPLAWDDYLIWAPHVYVEDGIYYMFYTSVSQTINQRIVLAISTNPADPDSWQVQTDWSFFPDHPGTLWEEGIWADCRDPYVFKLGNLYYLLYTSRDVDGWIVGLATADSLIGPWQDFGSILTLENSVPESPVIWQANGGYYLFYNRSDGETSDERFRFGPTPAGPWTEAFLLSPGWAHEVWLGLDNQLYTSFLTNYTVTIAPMIWNTHFIPPFPFIGAQIFTQFIPLTLR